MDMSLTQLIFIHQERFEKKKSAAGKLCKAKDDGELVGLCVLSAHQVHSLEIWLLPSLGT